jgi:hypothetical protein
VATGDLQKQDDEMIQYGDRTWCDHIASMLGQPSAAIVVSLRIESCIVWSAIHSIAGGILLFRSSGNGRLFHVFQCAS